MRLDGIERLLDSCGFTDFREIVVHYLRIRGYLDAPSTDGWRDGGSDLSIYLVPPNRTPVAVQVTTQRARWQAKLVSDAAKVRRTFKDTTHLTFVSSHRIADADFVPISDEIYGKYGITVRKIDNQAIASEYFSANRTADLLHLLGIEIPTDEARSNRVSVRERTAYSYLLFSDPSREFRSQVLDTVVGVALLMQSAPVERSRLIDLVRNELQLEPDQVSQVDGSIDRQVQAGSLVSTAGRISLPEERVRELEAAEVLREGEWVALRNSIKTYLVDAGAADGAAHSLAEFLVERAGSLCMASAIGLVSALADRGADRFENDIRDKMRGVNAALDEFGFDPGSRRTDVLREIADLIMTSPIASHMIAGEVFLTLTRLAHSGLVSALGSGESLSIYLDASVAMPVLACGMYEPAGAAYFRASASLYDQLRRHGIRMCLPDDYCEESATHLIDAYRLYSEIVDFDSDLRFSQNAYVAHYVSLKNIGHFDGGFVDYLKGFHVRLTDLDGPFRRVRAIVKTRVERAMREIGIEVISLIDPSSTSWQRAQEAISYGLRELRRDRTEQLLRHDTRTIASLMELDLDIADTTVLVTWDRLHLYVYEHEESYDWHVMTPSTLGDLLGVVRSDRSALPTMSAWMVSMALLDEVAELGAKVWDGLVHIEREINHDASLRDLAQQFKDSFLRDRSAFTRDDLAEAWERWKESYGGE